MNSKIPVGLLTYHTVRTVALSCWVPHKFKGNPDAAVLSDYLLEQGYCLDVYASAGRHPMHTYSIEDPTLWSLAWYWGNYVQMVQ